MGKYLKNANKNLQDELFKQLKIIYASAVVVLWNDYGWRKLRIARRLTTSKELWDECAAHGVEKSMMQMLEDETGIEIRLKGYDKSFHDIQFLDSNAWDRHRPSPAELVYIRQRQLKWVAPQILACLCLTMYRDEHMSVPKIAELISKVDEFRDSNNNDPDVCLKIMNETTGLTENDVVII